MPFCTMVHDMMLRDNEKTHDPQTDAAVKDLAEKRRAIKECIDRFDRMSAYATGYATTTESFAKDFRGFKRHECDTVADQLDAIVPTFKTENEKSLPIFRAQSDRLKTFLQGCMEFDRLHEQTNEKRVDYDTSRKNVAGAKNSKKQGNEAKLQAKEQKAALYEKSYKDSTQTLLALGARKSAEAAYLITDSTQLVLAAVADNFTEIGRSWQRERQLHVFAPAIQPVQQQQVGINSQQQQQGVQPGLHSAPHTAPGTPTHYQQQQQYPQKEQPLLPPQGPVQPEQLPLAQQQQLQQQQYLQEQQQQYQAPQTTAQQPGVYQQQQPGVYQQQPLDVAPHPQQQQQPQQQHQPQHETRLAPPPELVTVPVGPQPYAYGIAPQQTSTAAYQQQQQLASEPQGLPPTFATPQQQQQQQQQYDRPIATIGDHTTQQQNPALVHSG